MPSSSPYQHQPFYCCISSPFLNSQERDSGGTGELLRLAPQKIWVHFLILYPSIRHLSGSSVMPLAPG